MGLVGIALAGAITFLMGEHSLRTLDRPTVGISVLEEVGLAKDVGVLVASPHSQNFCALRDHVKEVLCHDDGAFGIGRSWHAGTERVSGPSLIRYAVILARQNVRRDIDCIPTAIVASGRLATVLHGDVNIERLANLETSYFHFVDDNIGSQLPPRGVFGNADHFERSFVGQDGNYERGQHQSHAEADDPGLNLGGIGHTLRRFVHSSLSREVVYLPLAGILLNALAGLFLGLFLHYLNGQRKWWPLLLSGGFASAGFGLIGLGLSA